MSKGVYLGEGKVVYRQPIVTALTGGNWEKGWSGTKRMGGDVVELKVLNRLDWWPAPLQEVYFDHKGNGEIMITKLGKKLSTEEYDRSYKVSTLF